MKQDMTQGSITRKLILFFLPIAASTIFQQFYNAADAIIVGKYVGTEALAAVGGSSANITSLLIGFFVSLSGGSSVLVAQLFGARREKDLKRAAGTAVTFCVLIGAALTVVGIIWAPDMLRLMKTPEDTMEGATIYLRIIFGGVIAQLIYNFEAGILRAVGDSRSPFIYMCICCVANILLDLLFVIRFRLGVAGVAYATVLAQVISMVLVMIKLYRVKEIYAVRLRDLCLDLRLLGLMMKVGIPTALQSMMYGISNVILQIYINILGTTIVAGWTLSGKVDGIYWSIINAAGTAFMNFVAQNAGAGNTERVKKGFRTSLLLFMGTTVTISGIIMAFGRLALPLFTDDAAVCDAAWKVMCYFVPIYFTWTLIEILSALFRGMGDTVVPTMILTIGICAIRLIWILVVFPLAPTLFTVSISYAISWTITDIAFIVYYRMGKWQKRALKLTK